MKGHLDIITPATNVGKELMEIPSFEVPDLTELFSQETYNKKFKEGFLNACGCWNSEVW